MARPQNKITGKPNLFKTWRKLKTENGGVFADALRALFDEFGITYSHSRFKSWEEGKRLPQTKVFNFILADSLKMLARDAQNDGDKKIIKKIKSICTL